MMTRRRKIGLAMTLSLALGVPLLVLALTTQQFDTRGRASSGEPPQGNSGLIGFYFSNTNLSGFPFTSQTDPTINFNWKKNAPLPGMPKDNFSIRWKGTITPPKSGEYTITANADDGVRLWIDDELIIDSWKSKRSKRKGKANLVENKLHNIRVEYFEKKGRAQIQLSWKTKGLRNQIIPSQFLSTVGVTTPVENLYNKDLCWNYVISTSFAGQLWSSNCKTSSPIDPASCILKLKKLTTDESRQYSNWQAAGSLGVSKCQAN